MSNVTQPTGYLRLKDVLALFPVSESTWYAGIKDGRYPKGHRLSPNIVAWKSEDIHALIAAKSAPTA